MDIKRTHKHSDSANSRSQSPGNTARDGERAQMPWGNFFPRGAGKGTETREIFPSTESLLALQPESWASVHQQPEVLGTGSGEK